MNSLFRRSVPFGFFLIGASFLALPPAPSPAQIQNGNLWPKPILTSIFPVGAKAGTSLEVAFNGTNVASPDGLWFSHPGIKATPVVAPEPTPDPKKPAPTGMKKNPPQVAKFNVAVDKSVPVGSYDVRLFNDLGISNPRVFVVGDLNEELEKEPNNDVEQAQKIAVGTTVNGRIAAPTQVDYFQVAAKKGERILFHAATASIDSRLHAEMRLFDAKANQLVYSRGQPNEDSLLDFTAPADGDYLLRMNHFTYTAGGLDHFYRLNVFKGPWIDAVHPSVVEPGKPAQVTIYGRGLPGGIRDPKAIEGGIVLEKLTVTINVPADPAKLDFFGPVNPWQGLLSGFQYRLGNSNPVLLTFATAPVVLENDDNDTSDKAQQVKVPCEIAGRIDKKRDRDWYAFDAKKGEVYIIDAFSHRLGAPTDLYFKLVDLAKKKDIVLQDDNPEQVSIRGFFTSTRDPAPYRFVVPEDGKYHLLVASHTIDGGPTHPYRLRISPERPDFRVIVMPSEDYRQDSFLLGRGGFSHFQAHAVRMDGFKGEITLTMEGLPAGVTCPPQVMAANTKSVHLVLNAGDNAPEKFDGLVKVMATATIDGKKVVREGRPASVVWGSNNAQGNSPSITRLDRGLMVSLRNKAPINVTPSKDKYVVLVGDKVEIPMKLNRIDAEFKGNFQITPLPTELPPGVTFAALTFAPGKDEQKLILTTQANAVPGTYSLAFRGFGPLAPPQSKGKGVNTIVPTGPIQLTVVPKQVGTLAVDNGNPPIIVGKEAVLTLKVARLFDYADAFKVTLLPENANGVSAAESAIGAGQNEVKITLKAATGVNPGQRSNLTLRAVAVVHGLTLNHDLKFNVNVMPEPKPPEPKKK